MAESKRESGRARRRCRRRRRIAKSGMTVSVHCTDRRKGSGWGSTVGPRTDASKPTFPRNRPISIAFGFLPLLNSGVRFRKSDCDRLASCAVYTGPHNRPRRRRPSPVRRATRRALSAVVAVAALVVGRAELWSHLLPLREWSTVEKAFAVRPLFLLPGLPSSTPCACFLVYLGDNR